MPGPSSAYMLRVTMGQAGKHLRASERSDPKATVLHGLFEMAGFGVFAL